MCLVWRINCGLAAGALCLIFLQVAYVISCRIWGDTNTAFTLQCSFHSAAFAHRILAQQGLGYVFVGYVLCHDEEKASMYWVRCSQYMLLPVSMLS